MQALRVRVLVIDDLEPWRRYICSRLQEEQYDVVGEASDGLEGIKKAEELQPQLILLDIGLPKLNGIETANRLSQSVPDAKILFLSQNDDAEVVRAALNHGAQGYVLKVDAASELLPAIKAVLRGEKFVSSGIKGLQL